MIKEQAIKFMFQDLKNDDVPVLLYITNLSPEGWNYIKLD